MKLTILILTTSILFACNQRSKQPATVQKVFNPEQNYYTNYEPRVVDSPPKKKKKHNPAPAKHTRRPDSGWIDNREPERLVDMAQKWEAPFAMSDTFDVYQITSTEYTVERDNQKLFYAVLIKDTLCIAPSLFDSTAKKAKVIMVGGETFELKQKHREFKDLPVGVTGSIRTRTMDDEPIKQ